MYKRQILSIVDIDNIPNITNYIDETKVLNFINNMTKFKSKSLKFNVLLTHNLLKINYHVSTEKLINMYIYQLSNIDMVHRFTDITYYELLDLTTKYNKTDFTIKIIYDIPGSIKYYSKLLKIAIDTENQQWINNILNMYEIIPPIMDQ